VKASLLPSALALSCTLETFQLALLSCRMASRLDQGARLSPAAALGFTLDLRQRA
jgi:hypothetical protein